MEFNALVKLIYLIKKRVKIITNQSGTKGFVCQGQFITDPYSSECMRSVVDPKQYYGLTDDELIHFKHLEPLKEEPQPSYEELVKDLKGMKFFIVRWSGDACDHGELFDDKCRRIHQTELTTQLNFLMSIITTMKPLKI